MDGEPVVVTDQNFPAVLFSADRGQCISIVRVEDRSIRDIGFSIADLLDGRQLPRGSTILVGSVSDLGWQGLVGYADELSRTVRILKEKMGTDVQVAVCPPILLGGINSYRLLRNVVEAKHWAEKLVGGGGILLRRTREAVKSNSADQGQRAGIRVKHFDATVRDGCGFQQEPDPASYTHSIMYALNLSSPTL
jgi:hypothetical protein